MENFVPIKRIRRFSHDITLAERGAVRVQIIENEKYSDAYKELFSLLSYADTNSFLSVNVAFISSMFLSFLCNTDSEAFTLNYSFGNSCFERDSAVLKFFGVKKKNVRRVLSKIGEKKPRRDMCVYPITGGVAVLCGEKGQKTLKIRNL